MKPIFLTILDFIDYYHTKSPEDIVSVKLVRQGITLRFDVILGQLEN